MGTFRNKHIMPQVHWLSLHHNKKAILTLLIITTVVICVKEYITTICPNLVLFPHGFYQEIMIFIQVWHLKIFLILHLDMF